MKEITYKTTVYFRGHKVGEIREDAGENGNRFKYYPDGDDNGGESFPTLEECKKSLGTIMPEFNIYEMAKFYEKNTKTKNYYEKINNKFYLK